MLRVRLLGELAIELDGTDVEPPRAAGPVRCSAWLALDRRMHSRSALAARFWPDVLDESARTSLRSALSALRKALGPDGEQYLIATRDGVGLAGDSLVWTDVGEFERCIDEDDSRRRSRCRGRAVGRSRRRLGLRAPRRAPRSRRRRACTRLAADAEGDGDLQSGDRVHAPAGGARSARRGASARADAATGRRRRPSRVRSGPTSDSSQRLRDELRIAPRRRRASCARRRFGMPARPRRPRHVPVAAAARSATGAVVTLLFTDLVGSTELLGAARRRRGRAAAARPLRTAPRRRDSVRRRGGQEPRRRADGRVRQRRQRRELRGRDPAGSPPAQRAPG